jgi:hypothetical protein
MLIHPLKKLGKLAPKHDPRTFRLSAVLPELPTPPLARDWAAPLAFPGPSWRNTDLGDCTCAAIGNAVRVATANHGAEVKLTDDAVLTAYSAVSGYDPRTGANDGGAAMLDVLNYWRKTGVGGHQIGGFVRLSPGEVETAINLFGGVYVGAALPLKAQHQEVWTGGYDAHTPEDVPGSWGGHAMWLASYDHLGVELLTWGNRQRADWAWMSRYADELYAVFSADWVSGAAPAPNGFDTTRLHALLAAL